MQPQAGSHRAPDLHVLNHYTNEALVEMLEHELAWRVGAYERSASKPLGAEETLYRIHLAMKGAST